MSPPRPFRAFLFLFGFGCLVAGVVYFATTPRSLAPYSVEFIYRDANPKKVFLVGEFNDWNTTATPMERSPDDEWKVSIPLKPGRYEYKFFVDGRWTGDPANTETAPDRHGGLNSVVVVNPDPEQDSKAERDAIGAGVHRLFDAGDFATIEKRADELRRSKRKLRNGRWELVVFYNAFRPRDFTHGDANKWRETFARLDEWHRKFPDSITQPVARAYALTGAAWETRGPGWAREVSEIGLASMEGGMQKAREVLEAAARLPRRCPEWYAAMQLVALGQGWKRAEYEQLFDEAVGREPTYFQYFINKAFYLAPRWYGRPGEWEKFAEAAARKYDPTGERSLYTRIAWSQDYLFGNLFRQSAITWPKMRDDFQQMMEQWPESAWNWNSFCRFACIAGDRATAVPLFAKIGAEMDYDVWHSRAEFDAAKRWADAQADSDRVQPLAHLGPREATRANAVAAFPDGAGFLVAYTDGVVSRWEPQQKRVKPATVVDFDAPVQQIALSSDGKLIAVALDRHNGKPGIVRIMDAVDGTEKSRIEDWHGGTPFALCFSAKGSKLVAVGGVAGQPGVAKIWDAQSMTSAPVPWPAPKHLLVTVALSPDGRLLLTNDDCNVRVWDVRENKLVFAMSKNAEDLVLSVAFSPDGKRAAAVTAPYAWNSDAGGELMIWDTSDWSEVKRRPLACAAQRVVFSGDGRYLAANCRDNSIQLLRTADWEVATELLPMGGFVSSLDFSAAGKVLAASTFDVGTSIWRLPVVKEAVASEPRRR